MESMTGPIEVDINEMTYINLFKQRLQYAAHTCWQYAQTKEML